MEASNNSQELERITGLDYLGWLFKQHPTTSGASFGKVDWGELAHRSLMSVLEVHAPVVKDCESRLPC